MTKALQVLEVVLPLDLAHLSILWLIMIKVEYSEALLCTAYFCN